MSFVAATAAALAEREQDKDSEPEPTDTAARFADLRAIVARATVPEPA